MTMRNAGKPYNEADKPTHTVTAGGAGLSLVAPILSSAQHGGSHRAADEPHRTIAASDKDQNQIIAATMVQTGYGEREGQEPRALDVEAPLGTVVAGGAKHAAVAVHMQRQFGASVGHAVDEPNASITAGGGGKSALVAAFLAQHNTGIVGHDARTPVSTLTTGGQYGAPQQAVVSAGLMNMKGSDRRMSDAEQPAPTVTATGNHVAEVRAFLMKYYGVDQDPRLEDPLSTVTTRDRFGIVTVEGEPYQIVDIGMRMLTPRKLFKAQGFPADYEIETGVFADGSRRALTKTAQVRMCGNSVCPPIAAALVAANCADMARAELAAAE
jgi:DNA (cytosine-5)-methyltransferase 1